jgi:hypothetical protein
VSDDLDAWLDDYKPYISSAKVCGRPDLIAAHTEAELALTAAVAAAGDMLADKGVSEARGVVEAVQEQIEASEKSFTFQGMGQRQWQDLKRKNPPNETQRREGLDTNMERFAPAAIAASSLDPTITVDQAEKMLTKLPPGEFEKLFQATLEANGQVIGAPKSATAAFIERFRQNGGSSITALPEESPEASSSDVLDET